MSMLNTYGVVTMEQLESIIATYVSRFTGYDDVSVCFDDYDRIRIMANSKLMLDFYFSKLCEVTGTIHEVGLGMAELFSIMSAVRLIEAWHRNTAMLNSLADRQRR